MLRVSKEAKALLESGFKGNGCGNTWLTKHIAKYAQRWACVDFSEPCKYHDAEWACEPANEYHRVTSDSNLYLNLRSVAMQLKYKKHQRKALLVARLFYWAVVLRSYTTYYSTKRKQHRSKTHG